MQERYWTSDTHFYHKKILDFCPESRKCENIEEMNETLIYNWNSRIKQGDIVYHLGDFSFGSAEQTMTILRRLNGQIHLIEGNHDGNFRRKEIREMVEYCGVYKSINFDDKYIVMMHYPIESWNKMNYGSIHLHGHTHGNDGHRGEIKRMRNRMDVGIDTRLDLDVYDWDEIRVVLKERENL